MPAEDDVLTGGLAGGDPGAILTGGLAAPSGGGGGGSDPGYDLYLLVSDDNGETWSTPTLAIPNAKHGTVATSDAGEIVDAGWIPNSVGATAGTLQARYQGPGDAAPGAVFTLKDSTGTNLSAADDQFRIAKAREGQDRWLLAVLIAGETATSRWASADNLATWTRIA